MANTIKAILIKTRLIPENNLIGVINQQPHQILTPDYDGQQLFHYGQAPMMQLNQIPMSARGPAYATNAALEELGNQSKIVISSPGRIDETLSQVNIQTENGQFLFSAQIQGTSRVVAANNQAAQFVYGAIYGIHDSSGMEVMSVAQETSSMHVTMSGRAVGSVQNNDKASTSFIASSITDGTSFQIEGDDECGLKFWPCWTESDFRIVSNRGEAGRMVCQKMATGKNLCVTFPPNANPNAKVLLMCAGIMIYIGYFGKTARGHHGSRGQGCAACCWCCCCCCCH